MYQTSEVFNGEILKTSRRFKARITTGEKIFQDEILTMTINLGSCGDTAFSFGTVFSSYAEIVLADTGQFLAGQELFIEIGLYLQDNTIEYVPLGYFTASSENISKTQGKISLKAADRFSACQSPYKARISYPAKIGDVLNDISAQTGIVIATSLNVSGTINKMPSNTTCLDLLGDIAGLLGGFCCVDRAGIVRINSFPSTVTREVLEQITMEHSFEEGVYKVGKISVSVGDDADTVYTDSDGLGNGIAVENPYITQPLFDSLKNKLIGYMYHPGTLSFLGDPRLDATDMISIVIDGETKTVPCMNIVHDFDGGLTTTVTAPGRSASDEQLKGPLQIQVEKARKAAEQAKIKANLAEEVSNQAKQQAENAKSAADEALASASEAQTKADNAVSNVGDVKKDVAEITETVASAKKTADNAWKAASTAKEDAANAKTSAANAEKNAADAKTAADAAGTKSDEAVSTATAAQSDAAEAKTNATKASETASAAKADAAQAQKEIDSLGKNLTTLSNTMEADYARKTDLTEAEASLKTKISQNAANIETTAKKVSVIDETANNAADLAATAQTKAEAAQTKADQATSEAAAAQTKADEASQAAQTAQSNADTAKAAAKNAQSVADKAKTDLAEAQKNLDTVKGRVDATEGDIAKAQKAVTTAQAAAEKAQSDANAAATKASSAQDVADAAKENASLAQTAANQASAKAEAAQTIANEAKVTASDAQKKAADAVKTASDAKTAANNAAQTASDAQDVANAAKANATAAQAAADDAKKKSDQAAADLVTAKKNLKEVSGRVDSTAEEVEAAKTAVANAQAAADKAKTDAATAQSTADTAKANASNAQKAADTAKTAADNAKKAADDAQKAADKAQDDVNALTKRVVNAETSIKQNSEAITLRATKKEVTQSIKDLQIGGRNLLLNSNFLNGTFGWVTEENCKIAASLSDTLKEKNAYVLIIANTGNGRAYNNSRTDKYHLAKTQYTLQFKYKTDDSSPVTFKVGVADSGYIIGNITAPADNTWRKFTATYTAPITGSLTIRITSGTGRILIGVPKLEYGNKATDWTPAPEDFQDDATTKANNALASAKTYADAQIKVTADSINQNVTKKIDDLQIGGRNYAVGTSNEWSEYWMPSTGVKICHDVTKIVVPDTFKKGDVFTTSIEIEWSGFKSSEGTFRLYTQGSQDGTWDKINPFTEKLADIRTESGSQLFKVTNTWDGKATNYIVGFQCNYSSGTGKIRWRRLKAEAGNKATDWTPAPEDLATADNVNDKLTEVRKEINSNIEQAGEAIKSSVYEKVYLKDDVDTLLSSVNTEVEQTKTSWQVTFNQLIKQLNDYSDGSDAAFDEIRKYIRFEDGNILLGNSSSPLILRIRNDRIQFLQNGYEVAYISDQRMYNTTCEIINQLRIADSAWTVETNNNGDTIVSLIGL